VPADTRFFERRGPVSPAALAELSGARLEPGDRGSESLLEAAPLDEAGPDAFSFCQGAGAARRLAETKAGAAFVHPDSLEDCRAAGLSALVTDHPEAAFSAAVRALFPPRAGVGGAPPFPDADIESSAVVQTGALVFAGSRIGPEAEIGPGAVIGPGVVVGAGCRIGAGARIGFALLGARVGIGANTVIGGEGFGVVEGPDGLVEAAHIGRVIIGDDVRVGALCSIDRGRLRDTVIGAQTKIDNHCHIAHNVRIGERCLMAAFAGVSGSCGIGDGVMFGGRVGLADHLTIGDNAKLGADAALMRSVPAGETWMGSPAKPARAFFREVATVERLAGTRGKRKGE